MKVLFSLSMLTFILLHSSSLKTNNAREKMQLEKIKRTKQNKETIVKLDNRLDLEIDSRPDTDNGYFKIKFIQLFDTINCFLLGYVCFDKAAILAWFEASVRLAMRPLGSIPKLLTNIVFLTTNVFMIHTTRKALEDLSSEQAKTIFGEDLKFQLSLYPNSLGAKGAIIAMPIILSFATNCVRNKEELKDETQCWIKIFKTPIAIANMFLPAFLPTQLFTHLFPLAIGQLFLGAEIVLLPINLWAFMQWEISEFKHINNQLHISSILFMTLVTLIVCLQVGCFKEKQIQFLRSKLFTNEQYFVFKFLK
jgi:hypothetical protein